MTKKKKPVPEPSLECLTAASGDDVRNRLLLRWLEEDDSRARLFAAINAAGGELTVFSRDDGQRERSGLGPRDPRDPPNLGYSQVTLVTDRARIEAILGAGAASYSNRVYAELGGGSFMLALDPGSGPAHAAQRTAYGNAFGNAEITVIELAELACQAASIISLRSADFDLAEFAEQAALRFCQKLMGYAFTDYRLLESTLRDAYRGLVYQVLGRHLVTDPLAVPAARQALGRLLSRTAALIDAYEAEDEDALKGCRDDALPHGFSPALKRLAAGSSGLNAEQRAVVAVGAAVGTVGNVQAAACIAIKALFDDARGGGDAWNAARELARKKPPKAANAAQNRQAEQVQRLAEWKRLIEPFLRANPPIPFLPRVQLDDRGEVVEELLLALGGATGPATPYAGAHDPLIWGLPTAAAHHCAGEALAWPLVAGIVCQVMRLPGLAEQLDAEDASVIGLTRRWGFACEKYPLTHRRDLRVSQSSLNVAMRLKSPVKDSADRVREVIRSGAPRIEEALHHARHVHFAWFELIESDTVLVLHTVYDGPFSAYIQHFALKVGDLFDELFAYIENPPPMPVDRFPDEFVAHIQRHDRKPAMGYFFSAYPGSEVTRILRDEWARP